MLVPRTALIVLFGFPLGLAVVALTAPELGRYVLWTNFAVVALALFDVAESQQRRTEDAKADDVDELGRARGCQLLVDHDLLYGRAPSAAELGRPRPAHKPRRMAGGLPFLQHGHPLVERVRQLFEAHSLAPEEGSNLLRECAL